MKLYHFSFEQYFIGQEVSLSEESKYHKSLVEKGMGWVNDLLDKHRNQEYPSRKKAVFAVDSKQKAYGLKDLYPRLNNSTFYIYQVEMEQPISAPMRLCGLIESLGETHIALEAIAKEYWNMTEDWRFVEYLSNKMKIIMEIKDYTPISINQSLVQEDFELARRKFKL